MLIRRAREADIDRIAHMETICFEDPWTREMVAEEFSDKNPSRYYIAEQGEDILGYAGIWLVPPEGYISNIAVHPDFRRRGIASALLGVLIYESLKFGVEDLSLEVRESNEEAWALYLKFGFEIEGMRPGYYRDGEDAYIMWRRAKGGE